MIKIVQKMIEQNKNQEHCSWPPLERAMDIQQQNELYKTYLSMFCEIVEKENLDEGILPQFSDVYIPLAAWLANKQTGNPIVIGINGAQGSGKSTLSRILESLLSKAFNKSVLHLSIDDLYLSQKKREDNANKIHPLLRVRGVPGTHNVELGHKILSGLVSSNHDINLQIPKYNKAQDNLFAKEHWQTINQSVDIILFEGWCVGAKPQHEDELEPAINDLERKEDPHAIWRKHVNQQLSESYQDLFNHIDYLIMLKVPDMESVFEWRNLQEEKLAASYDKNKAHSHIMSPSEISHFIMHYERLTRSCLSEMPDRADVVLELNKEHKIHNIKIKESM